jgi:hypothetical protein
VPPDKITLSRLPQGGSSAMVNAGDIRTVALSLPRTEEALVRDQVKFRVGRIVYVALSRDERSMGFGFPKEERAALVAGQPDKFFLPIPSDMRYNWVRVWLDAIDVTEARELVIDAWNMVVPKRVAAEYLRDHPSATTKKQLPPVSTRATKSTPSG